MTPPRTQSKKTSRAASLSRAFVPLLLTISTPIARPRPRVSPTIERSSHSFTRFRALPPIRAARSGIRSRCRISTVTIEILQRDRIPERAARIGGRALKRVKEWEDLSIVGETRGLGLAIGVEIVSDKGTKARDNDAAREVFFDCVRGGVIPLYDYEMNVLRIQPPLTIEEALLDKALDGMESALRKHAR